jgi:hypothetical protein
MRTTLAILVVALCALGASQELMLGKPGATQAQIAKLAKPYGAIGLRHASGLYPLTLHKGITIGAAKAGLKKSSVTTVNVGAIRPNTSSKASVDRYVSHMKGGFGGVGKPQSAGYAEAFKHFYDMRVDESGEINQELYFQSLAQRDQMPKFSTGNQNQRTSGAWQFIGPRRLNVPYRTYFGNQMLSGRKNGVAYCTTVGTYYAASAGGGVWKTTDFGTTWRPLSDGWPSLPVTGIAVHPSNDNIVYAGTGDYYGMGRTQTFGLMKSEDGGNSWTNLGRADFGTKAVSRIKVDRDDPSILIVTTGSGGGGGIYRSTTAGTGQWSAYRTDVNWDDIDYSIAGDRYLATGRTLNGTPVMVTSTDAGQTWIPLQTPTNAMQTLTDIAISKRNGSTWYVLYSSGQLFRTTNAGGQWTPLTNNLNAGVSNPTVNWSQSWYDLVVECGYGGTTQDYVFVGLLTLLASPNSGQNFADIGRTLEDDALTHNDHHFVAFHPNTGELAMVCNDGGIWALQYTPSSNYVQWTSLNATFYDTAFYAMAGHPANSNWILGGTQDNASPASMGNLNQWGNLNGGDGAWPAFNATGSTWYTSAQNGAVYMHYGDTRNRRIGPESWPRTAFIAPLVTAGNGHQLFLAADRRIKLRGSNGSIVGPGWMDQAGFQASADIVAMTVSPNNGNRIYYGTTSGQMGYIEGQTFKNFLGLRFYSQVGDVQESPHDHRVVLAANAQQGTRERVMITYDRTITTPLWYDISGTGATALPSTSVNAVAFDPHNPEIYYAGTDIGVFVTTNGGATWQNLGAAGLPNVRVNDLWINPGKTFLYAATFGRGIWRIPLVGGSLDFNMSAPLRVYGGQYAAIRFTFDSPTTVGSHLSMRSYSPDLIIPDVLTPPIGVTSWTYYAQTRTVSAIAGGSMRANYGLGTRTAITLIYPYPTVTLSLSKPAIYGGENVNATVRFATAAPFDTGLLLYDNAGPLITPSTVTVLAGTTSAQTQLTSMPVVSASTATVTAFLGGNTTTATLAIEPYPLIGTFTLTRSWVYGGEPVYGTIAFANTPARALSVRLSSSGTAASVPAALTFKDGPSGAFTVTTRAVLAGTWVDITAKVGTLASGISRRLSILPYPVPTKLLLDPTTFKGGGGGMGTIQLSNIAPRADAMVSLTSDSPLVTVPGSLLIKSGKSFGEFPFAASAPTKTTTVTLSANYNKVTRTATVLLTP